MTSWVRAVGLVALGALTACVSTIPRGRRLAAHNSHACALDLEGHLDCMRLDSVGDDPLHRVTLDEPAIALASGPRVSALLRNGRVLGVNDDGRISIEAKVPGAVDLASVAGATCVLRRDGAVSCWSDDASHSREPLPREVAVLPRTRALAATAQRFFALTADGVYEWTAPDHVRRLARVTQGVELRATAPCGLFCDRKGNQPVAVAHHVWVRRKNGDVLKLDLDDPPVYAFETREPTHDALRGRTRSPLACTDTTCCLFDGKDERGCAELGSLRPTEGAWDWLGRPAEPSCVLDAQAALTCWDYAKSYTGELVGRDRPTTFRRPN